VLLIVAAGAIALLAPNVIDMFADFRPVLENARANPRRGLPLLDRLRWRATPAWGLATGALAAFAVLAILGWQSEFLYFQF